MVETRRFSFQHVMFFIVLKMIFAFFTNVIRCPAYRAGFTIFLLHTQRSTTLKKEYNPNKELLFSIWG